MLVVDSGDIIDSIRPHYPSGFLNSPCTSSLHSDTHHPTLTLIRYHTLSILSIRVILSLVKPVLASYCGRLLSDLTRVFTLLVAGPTAICSSWQPFSSLPHDYIRNSHDKPGLPCIQSILSRVDRLTSHNLELPVLPALWCLQCVLLSLG